MPVGAIQTHAPHPNCHFWAGVRSLVAADAGLPEFLEVIGGASYESRQLVRSIVHESESFIDIITGFGTCTFCATIIESWLSSVSAAIHNSATYVMGRRECAHPQFRIVGKSS